MSDNKTTNLSEKLTTALNKNLSSAVKVISENAEEFGIKAYIVGGAIRDLLLEKPIYDLDFVIEGSAIEFCRFLEEKNLGKISQISEDFGTAKIEIKDTGLKIDLASTRTETYPKAGHLPVVGKIGCWLKDDILRRDFSVNALAVSINPESFGELIDYTGGLADLNKKQLRILHNNSFIDDPTRIIRGLRFAHKLNFSLESNTEYLQQKYLDEFNNNDICYERIKQVVNLAFGLNSAELYNDFINSKIYKLLTNFPRFKDGNAIHNAVCKNTKFIDPNNVWLIYLACAVPFSEAQKLNLSAKEADVLKNLDKLLSAKNECRTNFEIYEFFENAQNETIIAFSAIKNNIIAEKYLNELKEIKLQINGNDLKNLGFKEGKTIGYALKLILEQKLNSKIFDKKDEIELAKKILFGL